MSKSSPQSGVEVGASSFVSCILTLRVHHDTTSFSATFKERFTQNSIRESQCCCHRIHRVWIGADRTKYGKALFPEIPCRTTSLRFVLRSIANKQKARDLCASSQWRLDSVPFRKRMQELMTAIAALCEADHPCDLAEADLAPSSTLRPMRTTGLDTNTVSRELRTKITRLLAPSEKGWGYIYILRSQMDISTFSVLKIGFSKYHPEHRAHELASCLSAPEVVAHTPLIPHAKRIENLIHAELVAKRKVQKCGQCGQNHGEWFTISHSESRQVVLRWSRWILQQPYLQGKLSDEWYRYLLAQDFGSTKSETTVSELWGNILNNLPHQGADSTRDEQIAAYVNAGYFESIAERLLGPVKESPLKEELRNIERTLREAASGSALDQEDYSRVMDEFISAESKISSNLGDVGQKASQSTSFADPIIVDTLRKARELNPSTSPDKVQALLEVIMSDISAGRYDIDSLRKAAKSEVWKENASKFGDWKKQMFAEMEAIRNLKTGAVSVSDPKLGVTESPLGDATLLPVISLKTLQGIDELAKNWIGYNPTHQGFQLLQEAYQRGEWVGNVPQFQLPKALRKARVTKSSAEDATKIQASTGNSVCFIRSQESDTWEFSPELNGSFIERMNETAELAKNPLGRALIEKELLRNFKRLGLDFTGDYAQDTLSTSDESSSDEMDFDRMSIDEPEEQPEASKSVPESTGQSSASLSASTTNPNAVTDNGLKLSAAKAKKWLASM